MFRASPVAERNIRRKPRNVALIQRIVLATYPLMRVSGAVSARDLFWTRCRQCGYDCNDRSGAVFRRDLLGEAFASRMAELLRG